MSDVKKDFVAYEYKDITVDRNMETIYIDGYQNFGWQFVEKSSLITGITSASMKFKRDRRILNKAELTRLQRQFDSCANEIMAMEKSKHSKATITAIVVGLIGTAFMAGSVFAVTAAPPIIWLCVILAIPAMIGWILPYFLYKAAKIKRTHKVEPLIDMKYDEMYAVCEKASGLLPK